MTTLASCGWQARAATRWTRAALISLAGILSGCGGGEDAGASSTLVFANSQVLGIAQSESLTYVSAMPPALAAVEASTGGTALNNGSTSLTAEYVPTSPAGIRVACVSGNGTGIGVLDAINPGVMSMSAAVLLSAAWTEANPDIAWAAGASASEQWNGWENCGVKPEGTPSKSSTIAPGPDGSYIEDVFVGNPATNFTTVRLAISSVDAAAMRRTGHLTTEDPLRRLQITWRAYVDGAGHTVWVERGEPAPGAPEGTRGFITLFLPDRQS